MSLNSATVLLINQVVSERIDNRDMFTCFDITRTLRERGCNVQHTEIREVVHGLSGADLPPFRNSGFVRNSMIPMVGHNCNAEVYAHNSADAYAYDPDALATPTVSVTAAPAKVAAPAKSAPAAQALTTGTPVASTKQRAPRRRGKIDDKRRFTSRDIRGRVAIHNGFMKTLGLNPGDMAYISVRAANHPGLVVLTKASRRGHLGTYKVDKSGNVRLSRDILKKGKLESVSQFKMRLTDDKRGVIVVKN